jgi:Universal stress protein family
VLRGSPAGVLIAAAVDSGADLILTGSRGAGRIQGALLGSVSSQVLTHAPCSVMVIPDIEGSAAATRAAGLGERRERHGASGRPATCPRR